MESIITLILNVWMDYDSLGSEGLATKRSGARQWLPDLLELL